MGSEEWETERQRDGETEGQRDRNNFSLRLSVSPSLAPHSSVNFRLWRFSPRVQKIEVASLIGLRDVVAEERAEAPLITRRRWRPFGAPPRHLFFADQQIQF